jgi:hypothetical protein
LLGVEVEMAMAIRTIPRDGRASDRAGGRAGHRDRILIPPLYAVRLTDIDFDLALLLGHEKRLVESIWAVKLPPVSIPRWAFKRKGIGRA